MDGEDALRERRARIKPGPRFEGEKRPADQKAEDIFRGAAPGAERRGMPRRKPLKR